MFKVLSQFVEDCRKQFDFFLEHTESNHSPIDARRVLAAASREVRKAAPDDQSEPVAFTKQLVDAFHRSENPYEELSQVFSPQRVKDTSLFTQVPLPRDPHLQFVRKFGGDGTQIIRTVLVAANGLAAKKIIDDLRAWSTRYLGHPRALYIIAMATEEDERNYEYVNHADFVSIIKKPRETTGAYIGHHPLNNVNLIVETAKIHGADAIHAGWGWASEEAALSAEAQKAGIIFMGSTPSSMELLGDKVRSMLLFQSINGEETVAPWSGSGEVIDPTQPISDVLKRVTVHTLDEAKQKAQQVGFPVMLKASGVGGGRGMKLCYSEKDIEANWLPVVRGSEGSYIFIQKAAFQTYKVKNLGEAKQLAEELDYPVMLQYGDKLYRILNPDDWQVYHDEVLELFRTASMPGGPHVPAAPLEPDSVLLLGGGLKHIEVQVFVDKHGNVIVYWPRDCTVQRRNQKLIEESAYIKKTLAQMLMRAAANLTKSAGYIGVGTVEFLVDEQNEKIVDARYKKEEKIVFLEQNTRLQVEHPVTEGITGIDLVQSQMFIHQGVPAYKIPQIREYFGYSPEGQDPIPFDDLMYDKSPDGHTMGLRITAEDPENKLNPAPGKLHHLKFQDTRDVWGYFSLVRGGEAGGGDSQIAHIFVHAADRAKAIEKALVVLESKLEIFGELRTNIPVLIQILKRKDYREGRVHNKSLETWFEKGEIKIDKPRAELTVLTTALIQAAKKVYQNRRNFGDQLSRGRVPDPSLLNTQIGSIFVFHEQIKYEFKAQLIRAKGYGENTSYFFALQNVQTGRKNGDQIVEGRVDFQKDGSFSVWINDRKYPVWVSESADRWRLEIFNKPDMVFLRERNPNVVEAPMTGKIIAWLVKPGDVVSEGQPLCIIEAAKMENTILSPRSGVIEKLGTTQVTAGQGIVFFKSDDGVVIPPTKTFEGMLTPFIAPAWMTKDTSPSISRQVIEDVFNGYSYPQPVSLEDHLTHYLNDLQTQEHWAKRFAYFVSFNRKGMPPQLYDELMAYAEGLQKNGGNQTVTPAVYLEEIHKRIAGYESDFDLNADVYNEYGFRRDFEKFATDERHLRPVLSYVKRLLGLYIGIEQNFADPKISDPLGVLRAKAEALGMDRVLHIEQAHESLEIKNKVLVYLFDHLSEYGIKPQELTDYLKTLTTSFRGKAYNPVIGRAKALFFDHHDEHLQKDKQAELRAKLLKAAALGRAERSALIDGIAKTAQSIYTELIPLTYDADPKVAHYARLLYATRTYRFFPLMFQQINPDDYPAISFVYQYPESNAFNRFGWVSSFSSLKELEEGFQELLGAYEGRVSAMRSEYPELVPGNYTLTLIVRYDDEKSVKENEQSENLKNILQKFEEDLKRIGIKRITVSTVPKEGEYPFHFTYRVPMSLGDRASFETSFADERTERRTTADLLPMMEDGTLYEDKVFRNIEPPLAYLLDHDLMQPFHLTPLAAMDRKFHIYYAVDKKAETNAEEVDRRYFIRAMQRTVSVDDQNHFPEVDDLIVEALHNLDVAIHSHVGRQPTDWNEIFLNIVIPIPLTSYEDMQAYLMERFNEQKDELDRLKVRRIEIKFVTANNGNADNIHYRMTIKNQPHIRLQSKIAIERRTKMGVMHLYDPSSPDQLLKVIKSYRVMDEISRRRIKANDMGTTYAYDWPILFEDDLRAVWGRLPEATRTALKPDEPVVQYHELYLGENDWLLEDTFKFRKDGANIDKKNPSQTNGAVAFRMKLRTPEYPEGREIIFVVCNDVNVEGGSFSPRESKLYVEAAKRAKQEGIPFIVAQANVGARFGLEPEIVKRFKVDYSLLNPIRGKTPDNIQINYLYLSEADYEVVKEGVICERIVVDGEVFYQIKAIPGMSEGLDADSLRGSGAIAGISDDVYDSIYTASIISGYMGTGIGAYLARLLHRVIQNGPMILTGFKALNALMEAKLYYSNEQFGGRDQVMLLNGIAHWGVSNDAEAVHTVLRDLSFVPKDNQSLPPITPTNDIPNRLLQLPLEAEKKDGLFIPREFFDRDSLTPQTDVVMPGYGKTIIAGHGKLMGRGMGFITVELDPNVVKEREIPADPAVPESSVRRERQFLRTLFPDSAYKLAEAVKNDNRAGLPIIIFPNFRGFSGGTRDMFQEILKFGSMIVEAIRQATVPIYIYFPFDGELRGGAWVVFDKDINSHGRVRMYADTTSRGGVLEAKGSFGILSRKDYVEERLQDLYAEFNPHLENLYKREKEALAAKRPDDEVKKIQKEIRVAEKEWQPVVRTIVEVMADLQHRAEAMKQRGIIDDVIPWEDARFRFHNILERDLELLDFERKIVEFWPTLKPRLLKEWVQKYAEAIDRAHQGDSPWALPVWREEFMREIAKQKAIQEGRDSFRLNPVAALEGGLQEYLQIMNFSGEEAEPEMVGHFSALIEGVKALPSVEGRRELYQKVITAMKPLGLWRDHDSDENHPVFFDAQGHLCRIEISGKSLLEIELLEGWEKGWIENWKALLKLESSLLALRGFSSVVFSDQKGVVTEIELGSSFDGVVDHGGQFGSSTPFDEDRGVSDAEGGGALQTASEEKASKPPTGHNDPSSAFGNGIIQAGGKDQPAIPNEVISMADWINRQNQVKGNVVLKPKALTFETNTPHLTLVEPEAEAETVGAEAYFVRRGTSDEPTSDVFPSLTPANSLVIGFSGATSLTQGLGVFNLVR